MTAAGGDIASRRQVAATTREVAAALLELTKPRITLLLLITCVASMVIAAQGAPHLGVFLWGALGLAMTSGGASALNHVLDRDIDALMVRTQNRPIVSGVIGPAAGTTFGTVLMIIGTGVIWAHVNELAALLSFLGGSFYVVVYTVWLKRTTVQNIVIGGAAGAAPPLVGYAAVTGSLDATAWLLFAIVFMWTPPHFWALAILIKDDYADAGVPMLPVVKGVEETSRQILAYAVALTAVSVIPVFADTELGWIYGVGALLLGARFIQLAYKLQRTATYGAPSDTVRANARKVFLFSMAYLAFVFLIAVVDASL